MTFDLPRYQAGPARPGHHAVIVVGAGLVGLTLALDLARRGIATTVLDDDDTVSTGSRAICMAQRSLEIFGRLGLGPRMLAKGVTWHTGRVFLGERELFDFDLQPEEGHEYPAFINLQQYYAEAWLVDACDATGLVNIRWKHEVLGLDSRADGATVHVACTSGEYSLTTDWLVAADGARSVVRRTMELPFVGRVFRDRFLIADVVMQAPFPTERWFWFDPPFHRNQSALLHKQPDNVWRIDLQLGWDADPVEEVRPERVIPRVQAMLGPEARFTLEWVSLYTFRCRRLERFVHGRVVFAGDSAHQVSPFGARGGNGGVQDADNLGWKLAAVIEGRAPPALIDSYDAERIPAADENILHSTRATDFITPKSPAALAYRDAALRLAETHSFARSFVNSGRLSRPCVIPISGDTESWDEAPRLGSAAIDAPVLCDGRPDWLLRHLGRGFSILVFGPACDVAGAQLVRIGQGALEDVQGLVARRYGGAEGRCVLFRPDQHVAALFLRFDAARIEAAIAAILRARVPQHA